MWRFIHSLTPENVQCFCCFVFRVKETFELEVCEVLAGVGSLRSRIFPVHCISLSDPDPHHFHFSFNVSSTLTGKSQLLHSELDVFTVL